MKSKISKSLYIFLNMTIVKILPFHSIKMEYSPEINKSFLFLRLISTPQMIQIDPLQHFFFNPGYID